MACGWLAEWLEKAGFEVQRNGRRAGHRRSWAPSAQARSTSPSLPNTTRCPKSATPAATTSSPPRAIGAGVALAAVADELGMRVSVIGTPAEEGGGGKIVMIDAASSTTSTAR